MDKEQYKYTYLHSTFGTESEEECFITKDSFHPFGEVEVGQKLRGEFGFMKIIRVFEEASHKYGKFVARSIPYEEMKN